MKSYGTRCLALLGAALWCAACSGETELLDEDGDTTNLGRSEQAFTPSQPRVRPTIYDFTASQRTTLVNGILAFITQPVLDEHSNGHDWHHPAVGELFFSRHHDYLKQLETYLSNNGLGQFVPVPEWSPGTAIPSQFMVADPLVPQSQMNQNPNRPPPAAFADNQLCAFATPSAMAVQVESWHDGVHSAVGGPMGSVNSAPGAPIFWLWHGLLDDMYHERTWRCETVPALFVGIAGIPS
jgi:hypothetical protein